MVLVVQLADGEGVIEGRVGGVAVTLYVWSAAGGGNSQVEADLSQAGGGGHDRDGGRAVGV